MNAKLKQEIKFINTDKKIHQNCCNFLLLGIVKFTDNKIGQTSIPGIGRQTMP